MNQMAKKVAWFDSMLDTIDDAIKKAELHIEKLEEQQDALETARNALELYDRFMSMPQVAPAPVLPDDVIPDDVTVSVPSESEVNDNA